MKIFVFENIIGNYCSGDFYFIADNQQEAITIALDYQREHNNHVKDNLNYTIEFDQEEIREFEIKKGIILLNRTDVPVIK